MNAMIVRGQMNRARGEFRTRLCRMTGNDLGRANGYLLKLVGKAQVTYGRVKDTTGRRIRKFTHH